MVSCLALFPVLFLDRFSLTLFINLSSCFGHLFIFLAPIVLLEGRFGVPHPPAEAFVELAALLQFCSGNEHHVKPRAQRDLQAASAHLWQQGVGGSARPTSAGRDAAQKNAFQVVAGLGTEEQRLELHGEKDSAKVHLVIRDMNVAALHPHYSLDHNHKTAAA
eukprot:g4927.t1